MLLGKSGEIAPERELSQSGNNAHLCMNLVVKEHYCLGTWNVRSMNQGKLDVVKKEIKRVNIDIIGINELKWT